MASPLPPAPDCQYSDALRQMIYQQTGSDPCQEPGASGDGQAQDNVARSDRPVFVGTRTETVQRPAKQYASTVSDPSLSNVPAAGALGELGDPRFAQETGDIGMGGVARRPVQGTTEKEVQREKTVPASKLYGEPAGWNQTQRSNFYRSLVKAGYVDPTEPFTMNDLLGEWRNLVDAAADAKEAGYSVTPHDMLGMFSSSGISAPEPRRVRTTEKVTRLIDPSSARSLLENALLNELGRTPTPKEFNQYLEDIREAERKNPTISKEDRMFDPATGQLSRVRNPEQTVQEGLNEEAFTGQYAEEDVAPRERAAYQAAGVYMPALMQAVGAPV